MLSSFGCLFVTYTFKRPSSSMRFVGSYRLSPMCHRFRIHNQQLENGPLAMKSATA
ncbi:unnamed protein product [Arabidopsis halleri]